MGSVLSTTSTQHGAALLQSQHLGSTGRRSKVQHPWLHSEFEVSLRYMRICLKTKQISSIWWSLCYINLWTLLAVTKPQTLLYLSDDILNIDWMYGGKWVFHNRYAHIHFLWGGDGERHWPKYKPRLEHSKMWEGIKRINYWTEWQTMLECCSYGKLGKLERIRRSQWVREPGSS